MLEDLKRWRVVHERLEHWAMTRPDDPFVRCGGEWITFGELDSRSRALAGALGSRGIAHGDRVAVVLPNCEEMVVTIFALARLGAIQVPINIFLKGEFMRHQLADSRASALIADSSGVREAEQLRAGLTDLRTMIQVGDASAISGDVESFDALLEERTDVHVPADVVSADLISILYTSGTTGLPKGCMLSHGYYTSLSWAWYADGWYKSSDRIITAMPLFHIGGQALALVGALLGGLSISVEPTFSARAFIDCAAKVEATVAYGVGPMAMAMLATAPSDRDREHQLRLGIMMPLSPTSQKEFSDRFNVAVVSEVYGQTECVASILSPLDGQRGTPACIGKPSPHIQAMVVDQHDNALGTEEIGELVLRPLEPDVMFSGYWNNPAATVATFRNLWHHTGDAVRVEADGYFTFIDRIKDSMRRRGENISSLELEAAIVQHPNIVAAATHGVPSPLGEDDVKAWIVLESNTEVTPEELHSFFVSTIPYFAVPRYVQIVNELPANALGRVQKFELRAMPNDDAWDFEALGLTVTVAERR